MKSITSSLLFLAFLSLAFESAPVPSPDHSEYFYEQGVEQKNAGQIDSAEESFKKAIEINPKRWEYHFELSNIYALRHDWLKQDTPQDTVSEGMLRACQRELEETLLLAPDYLPAIYNLGVVFKNLGEYERAREQFKKVLLKAPDQASAHVQIGSTYEAQGFYDEARDSYKDAKALEPRNPEFQRLFQQLEAKEADYKAAERQQMRIPPELLRTSQYRKSISPLAERYGAQDAASGQQALPFAGMALLQEFMKNFQQRRNE